MSQGPQGVWPDGPTPVVDEIQVAYVERDGHPVALVRFTDALGNYRDLEMTERAAWAAMVGFTHFLRQSHRGQPCRCGLSYREHPNAGCAAWH